MINTNTIDKLLPKKERYGLLYDQIVAVTSNESDLVANLSNICAILKHEMDWFWVGFYIIKNNELVLAPFQGPLACTRIAKGRGVCGTAWEENKTMVVPNVQLFENHIACSSLTKSEIVIPIKNNKNECIAVLDVDSDELNSFNQEDQLGLEHIVNYISQLF